LDFRGTDGGVGCLAKGWGDFEPKSDLNKTRRSCCPANRYLKSAPSTAGYIDQEPPPRQSDSPRTYGSQEARNSRTTRGRRPRERRVCRECRGATFAEDAATSSSSPTLARGSSLLYIQTICSGAARGLGGGGGRERTCHG
jgi:hypothetical protein